MTRHNISYWTGICSRCGATAAEIERDPMLPCLDAAEKARREIRLKAGLDTAHGASRKSVEAVQRAMRR